MKSEGIYLDPPVNNCFAHFTYPHHWRVRYITCGNNMYMGALVLSEWLSVNNFSLSRTELRTSIFVKSYCPFISEFVRSYFLFGMRVAVHILSVGCQEICDK